MNMNAEIKGLHQCQINIMRLEKEKADIENDLSVARMEEEKLILDSFETSESYIPSIPLNDKLLGDFIWGPNEIKQTIKWQEKEDSYTDTDTNTKKVQKLKKKIKKVQQLKKKTTSLLYNNTQVYTNIDKHFSLYTNTDNQHLNQVHILIRQFILEGYVVSTKHNMHNECMSQVKRYADTVGFRCQWCKHIRSIDRAKLASVYPRTNECIYNSVIRFQKHHIL